MLTLALEQLHYTDFPKINEILAQQVNNIDAILILGHKGTGRTTFTDTLLFTYELEPKVNNKIDEFITYIGFKDNIDELPSSLLVIKLCKDINGKRDIEYIRRIEEDCMHDLYFNKNWY